MICTGAMMGGAAYLHHMIDRRELLNMAGLIEACESGNLDELKRLIKNGKNPRDVRPYGSTLLHIACRFV